jgi:hypothetical protein
MPETARPVPTGTAGGTGINVDLRPLDCSAPQTVNLSANYTIAYPPGYPSPPSMTGCAAANLSYPRTIASGQPLTLTKAEAAALIAAGKAS